VSYLLVAVASRLLTLAAVGASQGAASAKSSERDTYLYAGQQCVGCVV
jgi:hypothetical protein